MQVMYLGRAPRTKETLPDFLKWRRVTRPPLVFRGLTGSQRTPWFWGVTNKDSVHIKIFNTQGEYKHIIIGSDEPSWVYRRKGYGAIDRLNSCTAFRGIDGVYSGSD